MPPLRGMLFVAAAIGLTGCATQPPEARSARAEAEFEKLVAGKVAGDPISCLQTYRSGDMVRIDNSTVAFKDGRRVYVNHLIGECSGLGSGFYALETRSNGTGLCRGDIARVRDTSTGTIVGACAIGEFTPYTAG